MSNPVRENPVRELLCCVNMVADCDIVTDQHEQKVGFRQALCNHYMKILLIVAWNDSRECLFHFILVPELQPTADRLTGCKLQKIAEEIADNEIAHVRLIRSALGAAAVKRPLIDIGKAFATAADAALNMTLKPAFSPYTNDIFFYHGAHSKKSQFRT